MSWVKQGGEGEGWVWIDDGTGNPAVAGDNANNYAGGGSGLLNSSGGGWRLPGKGQWNNQPYEYGPSDWRGIPFAQRDTQGNMLSKYQNAVDQLQAARQPISIGQQFGRWNFGGQLPGTGTGTGGGSGNPPIAIDPWFTPPAGGGGSGTPGGNGTTTGGGGAGAPDGFGPFPAPAGANPSAWQSFRFANPANSYQQNYNWLANNVSPTLAMAFATSPGSYANVGTTDTLNALAQQMNSTLGGSYYGPLLNMFQEGGNTPWLNQTYSALGAYEGWLPPRVQFNPNGTITYGGTGSDAMGQLTGGTDLTLPYGGSNWAAPTPWWASGGT